MSLPKSHISCPEFWNVQFKAQKSRADLDYHELMKGHDVVITYTALQRNSYQLLGL